MMDNDTILETENLFIKKIKKTDFRDFLSIHQNPITMKYFDGGVKTLQQCKKRVEEIIQHQIKYGFSYYNLYLKERNTYVGQAGLYYNYDMTVNLCYALLPKYYGNGYATEAIISILKFGFEKLHFETITAMSTPDNTKSRYLLEKLGAKYKREITFFSGTKALLYHIIKEDFEKALLSLKKYEYRNSVGCIIKNKDGLIYFFQRNDFPDTWQSPEGGIEINEKPIEAIYREIKEEIGINKNELKFIGETKKNYRYNYLNNEIKYGYIGQRKKFFLFEFNGNNNSFSYNNSKNQEFKDFKLVSKNQAIDLVPIFKKNIYKNILNEFNNYLK